MSGKPRGGSTVRGRPPREATQREATRGTAQREATRGEATRGEATRGTAQRRSPKTAAPPRVGPRGGGADTRGEILTAARALFGERGYSGTTLRAVAGAAGVDVALVPYYFGRKENLFAAAMDLPVRPGEVIEPVFSEGPETAGPRMVEMFLDLWEGPESGPAMLAMFRSAAGHDESRRALREFVGSEILARYAAHLDPPHARRRAVLAASQLIGMAMLRYLIRVEPAASMSRAEVVADLGPTVQRYLTGPLPEMGEADA